MIVVSTKTDSLETEGNLLPKITYLLTQNLSFSSIDSAAQIFSTSTPREKAERHNKVFDKKLQADTRRGCDSYPKILTDIFNVGPSVTASVSRGLNRLPALLMPKQCQFSHICLCRSSKDTS